jgi:tetratricopeptide (TPR) repeat protein
MDSRLIRWCNGFLEACWLVAILAIPLFFNIQSDRVFEPDKIALLRSLALLMAAAWIVKFIDGRGWRDLSRLRFSNPSALWHQPFVLPILVLVIVYLLATLFSVTPRVSWAGSYQRLQGAYTTLSYIVIFAMMAAGIRSAEQVRRIVTVAIVTSVPVALYGLVQHFGHDPLPWGGNVQNRVAGHLGNAIFIAAYLIMVLPLTLGRVLDAFSNILSDEKMAAADVLRASVYTFVLAIQLLAIYWSGSRGPLIGLGVGLFSFILVLLVSLRDTTGSRGGHRLREAMPAFLFLLPSLLALLLSNTISNLAGPLFALIFFFGVVGLSVIAIFVLVAARRGWSWLWLSWILLTVFLAGWLLLFNVPSERSAALSEAPLVGGLCDVLEEWRELPGIGSYGRMLDPSNTTGREKSGRVRVLIWEGVVDLISPHAPLVYPNGGSDTFNWLRLVLGYGPESMYVAYNPFYPPELATVEARNASPDRSHNETFDTLVITGIAGLLAWQALYLTVVHFAFRYLGVVRSRRDTWVLIGLWIGGASVAAAVAAIAVDPIYLGVAVPTGVILGVVIYLIYYALIGRSAEPLSPGELKPFAADRLLMNALVAAVLAHYVEIHFGIAISATRLYFFVFLALIFALGFRLRQPAPEPSEGEAPAVVVTRSGKGKRKAQANRVPEEPAPRSDRGRLLVPAILLTLMLGILGYGFITYALPPDKVITSPADLSAMEIFRQSLLQNVRRDFAESPFVFTFFILSWMLGWLIFLSEMIKHGEIRLPQVVKSVAASRRQLAAGVMATLGLIALAARFLIQPATLTATLGQGLGLVGGIICLGIAVLLLLDRPSARAIAGTVAASLTILSFPVAIGGNLIPALVMLAGGLLVLWLLWDISWRGALFSIGGAVLASVVVGFLIILLHAAVYRSLLFFRTSAGDGTTATLRALEAINASNIVVFAFGLVILSAILLAFALSWPALTGGRRPLTGANAALSFGSLAIALLTAIFLIAQTNVRPVRADMVYKRAKPYDDQASNATQTDTAALREAWDTAIAIYEAAVGLAPTEDFYYLFLGRAYLERAGITEDPIERTNLLTQAENLLLRAQSINPLNTDHTANLARLNTRWIGATDDDAEKAERLGLAERYYTDALRLSPQNSIIRNELARLVLELFGDCDRALAIYDESTTIDPFYASGHLARANAYIACADGRQEAERDEFYRSAASSLEQALQFDASNIRAWVQLAEIYRQLGEYEEAQAAVEGARAANEPITFPPAEIDFLAAQVAAGLGNATEARELAERALETAGNETAALIETFLDELEQ